MFNEEIATEIVQKYGRKSAILYCKIESFKFRRQAINLEKIRVKNSPNEFIFEAEWWENKLKQLESEV
jgi:hypothetical protein